MLKKKIINETATKYGTSISSKLCNVSIKFVALGALVTGISIVIPELAIAASKLDVDAGITAGASPFTDALKNHWGKGILLGSGGTLLFGEGDPKQRAIRALMAAGAGSAVVLMLLAGLNN